MTTLISRFLADESGATAVEYGLIASLVALAIIVAAGSVGTKLNGIFGNVAGYIKPPT